MGNARGAFYARPSASQVGEKRQVEEVDLSFFFLPPFVCSFIAAGVVSCTFARYLTIDGSLIFARERLAVSSVASLQQTKERFIRIAV